MEWFSYSCILVIICTSLFLIGAVGVISNRSCCFCISLVLLWYCSCSSDCTWFHVDLTRLIRIIKGRRRWYHSWIHWHHFNSMIWWRISATFVSWLLLLRDSDLDIQTMTSLLFLWSIQIYVYVKLTRSPSNGIQLRCYDSAGNHDVMVPLLLLLLLLLLIVFMVPSE